MSLRIIKKRLTAAIDAVAVGDVEGAMPDLDIALELVDELIREGKKPIAVQLGSLGGAVTAKRGSDYFRELAARRKTNAGGRPRKVVE